MVSPTQLFLSSRTKGSLARLWVCSAVRAPWAATSASSSWKLASDPVEACLADEGGA